MIREYSPLLPDLEYAVATELWNVQEKERSKLWYLLSEECGNGGWSVALLSERYALLGHVFSLSMTW
mgnify:CR=1 FL=1